MPKYSDVLSSDNIIIGGFNPSGRFVSLKGKQFYDATEGILYTQNRIPSGSEWTVTKTEVALVTNASAGLTAKWGNITGDITDQADLTAALAALQLGVDSKVSRSGDTMTGFLTLHADPTSALHAATKQYVDASVTASNVLTNGHILVGSAGNVATDVAMSGDTTITNAGVVTIGTNKVTYAKFQQVAASSLVGNPTGALANAQAITLGAGLTFAGSTLVNSTSGAATSIGAIDGVAKAANGANLTANVLYMQTADATAPGLVSTGTQTWAGNKGIGGAPVTEFTVYSTQSGVGGGVRGITTAQYNTGNDGARAIFRKGRGTLAVPVILTTGDTLGNLIFEGYDGANYLQMGSIQVKSTGTIALTRIPTQLSFSTATNAAPSVLTEAMRIDESQNVTINTFTNNTHRLNVTGTTSIAKFWGSGGNTALSGGQVLTLTTDVAGNDTTVNLVGHNSTNSRNRVIFTQGATTFTIGWSTGDTNAKYLFINGAGIGARYDQNGNVAFGFDRTVTQVTRMDILASADSATGGIALWNTTGSASGASLRFWLDGTGSTPNAIVGYGSTAAITINSLAQISARIKARVVVMADAASFTPTADTADTNTQVNTQALGTLTANAPSGTPLSSQELWIRIKSTNVQTFAWDAIYRAGTTLALPTTTTGASKTDYFLFKYNGTDSKWDLQISNYGY